MNLDYIEKIDIIQGCAYADICNVFEDHSLIITCISWPCKNAYDQDYELQVPYVFLM